MNRKTYALILTALLAVGCTSKANSNDAIQKTIMDYLASRPGLDVSKMDVTINKAAVNGDRAEVDVTFSPKGAPTSQGMAMHYTLTRSGDAWRVQAPSGGHTGADQSANPHGNTPPMASGPGGAAG